MSEMLHSDRVGCVTAGNGSHVIPIDDSISKVEILPPNLCYFVHDPAYRSLCIVMINLFYVVCGSPEMSISPVI